MFAYYNQLGQELAINLEVTTVQMKMPRICGPKLSNCRFAISIWEIIVLIPLGIFYNVNPVVLVEDVLLKEVTKRGKSTRCWILAQYQLTVSLLPELIELRI